MAKSKSFFGLRKGSTKTLTFQVVNGAQVTKDRVAFVKNPRTESQMANRCLMATASAAYRAMREIVDHSFEGYTYGQQNMSQFISQNITLLRNNAAIGATEFGYNRYRDHTFHPGAYKISKGSLVPTAFDYNVYLSDNEIEIDLFSGTLSTDFTANDVAAKMGLAVGEMITICTIYPNEDGTKWNFGFTRIKFIKAGTTALTSQNMSEYFDLNTNIGYATMQPDDTNLSIYISQVDCKTEANAYSGVIYSRHTTQGWLRSTAYIEVPDGEELTPDYDTALATYPQGSNYILNGGTVSGGGGKSPTPTPIAPEGAAQIFANAACTQYPTGLTTDVYVRINRNISENVILQDSSTYLSISINNRTIEGDFDGNLYYNTDEFDFPIVESTVIKLATQLQQYVFDGEPVILN